MPASSAPLPSSQLDLGDDAGLSQVVCGRLEQGQPVLGRVTRTDATGARSETPGLGLGLANLAEHLAGRGPDLRAIPRGTPSSSTVGQGARWIDPPSVAATTTTPLR